MNVKKNKLTHIKGLIGELEFTSRLIKNGWGVFTPLDQNSRVDLILEREGKLKKIQVKYCTPYRGCLRIDLEHRLRKTIPLTPSDLDAIGVYDSTNKKFYLVPFSSIYPRQGVWLRVSKSGNNQDKNIHWAKDFEI